MPTHPGSESAPKKKRAEEKPARLERQATQVLERAPERLELPILFIPFEGNFANRMMGGYERTGNQTSSIVEGRGTSPVIERGGKQITGDMESTFGSMPFWSARSGQFEKKELLASNKGELMELLDKLSYDEKKFYETVAADRLMHLRFSDLSEPEHGLPEVIVLSERLLEWPETLEPVKHRYHKCRNLARGVNLQEMAAYVLHSVVHLYSFRVVKRSGRFDRSSFEETWLLVTKGSLTVACVHLSSQYTKARNEQAAAVFKELIAFARDNRVHAIMGDFNLNTYGVRGGSFPVSSDFDASNSNALKTTFASSSGSGDKAYMGGMLCDPRVSFLPTLSTFGNFAVPPWFTHNRSSDLALKVFSDHHSLYCRYGFYPDAALVEKPSSDAGGDCFFEALGPRLARDHLWRTLSVAALRAAVIDAIAPAVRVEPNYQAGRYVLRQAPDSDFALPFWCASANDFLTELRQPGRWVEDTIIPFIALAMRLEFVIQYAGGYAVFDVLGGRTDHLGRADLRLAGIHMTCHGNHFW